MSTKEVTLKEIDGGREATIAQTEGDNFVLEVDRTSLLIDGNHFRRQLQRLGLVISTVY